MRRRGGVTQPSRDGLRLLCLNLLEGMAPPIAVVAVAQQWLDFRVESERLGSLSRSQLGAGPTLLGAWQLTGHRCGTRAA